MSKIPSFYCMKTLMGYGGQDLNRITLNGPDGFEFVLYKIGEERSADANERCNQLASALQKLWDAQK